MISRESERYKAMARGGKKLEITPGNLKWHIEQRYDEIEEIDGHDEAMKMYLRDESWDVSVQARPLKKIAKEVFQDYLAICPRPRFGFAPDRRKVWHRRCASSLSAVGC